MTAGAAGSGEGFEDVLHTINTGACPVKGLGTMASLLKRGKTYCAQYCVVGKAHRVNLSTSSLPVAKEKLRRIESRQARKDELPFATRTPRPTLLAEYREHLRQKHTANSLKADLFYLRERLSLRAGQHLVLGAIGGIGTGFCVVNAR